MSVGVRTLFNCVNDSIQLSTELEPIQTLQLSSAVKDFEQGFICSVANIESLPDAANNRGRMIYVQDKCGYRISDGVEWNNEFKTIQCNTIWGWGAGDFSRVGDNSTTNRSSPVPNASGFCDWIKVDADSIHNAGLRRNGSIWVWGSGEDGRVGDGTTAARSSPVSFAGNIFSDWCDFSLNCAGGTALRTNGELWAWGLNSSGELGNNTTINRSSPVSVSLGFTDWRQVSGGGSHNVGLRVNGTIWTWGLNSSGQLGDNTTINRSSPVSVVGGFTDWCQIAAGNTNNIALRSNGTAWSWGNNGQGRLGDNTQTNRSSPVSVVGGFTDWCKITAGTRSHGIRTNGTAWSWGNNTYGTLGNNSVFNQFSPVSVVGGFTDWCGITNKDVVVGAVRKNGTIWTWGRNDSGQLGDNTTTCRSSPVSVVGGFTDWCQIAAGFNHFQAIRNIWTSF
jgi:alpha-tubulin suppressor-like RCC1 family protein